ncbi:MAG: winged helix-turn-helix transcriptional regulator [Eubacterium sp.]|nr:winged helix-turn-helix transcriptional regulator [Eubacterium sp.]
MQDFWINVIPYGKENAIHQKELAARLGISVSTLKKRIRQARCNNIEIISSKAGYYFPNDEAERRDFVTMQEKQAKTRFATSKRLRDVVKAFDRMEGIAGQMKMQEFVEGTGYGEKEES